jgi:hypothetical protein
LSPDEELPTGIIADLSQINVQSETPEPGVLTTPYRGMGIPSMRLTFLPNGHQGFSFL